MEPDCDGSGYSDGSLDWGDRLAAMCDDRSDWWASRIFSRAIAKLRVAINRPKPTEKRIG